MRSHIPCGETLLNSTPEVPSPGFADLIFPFPNELHGSAELSVVQSPVSCDFNAGLNPDLRFSILPEHLVFLMLLEL